MNVRMKFAAHFDLADVMGEYYMRRYFEVILEMYCWKHSNSIFL
jgi:hypothetical protein